MDSFYMMLMATIVTPLLTTFAGELVKWIKSMLSVISVRIYNKKYNVITIVNEEYRNSKDSRIITVKDNADVITAILWTLHKNNVKFTNGSFDSARVLNVGKGNASSYVIPSGTVMYKNMIISYQEDKHASDNITTWKTTIVIKSSTLSVDEIYDFITTCVSDIRARSVEKNTIVAYLQKYRNRDDTIVTFREISLPNTVNAIDKLYFPEKHLLKCMANKLRDGHLTKLSFLLHGAPGCGKTTIVRALAAYLNYDIVEIKLAELANDSELTHIFHDNRLQITGGIHAIVDKSKCIFLFEDIDAECKQVLSRENNDKPPEDVSMMHLTAMATVIGASNSKNPILPNTGVTLSGLLNVLDGIVAMKGIVIMTTNHIEKLDAALIRPGRITRRIELQKMLAVDAAALIEDYFGAHDIVFKDYQVTIATLGSLCQSATTIAELKEFIAEEIRNNAEQSSPLSPGWTSV